MLIWYTVYCKNNHASLNIQQTPPRRYLLNNYLLTNTIQILVSYSSTRHPSLFLLKCGFSSLIGREHSRGQPTQLEVYSTTNSISGQKIHLPHLKSLLLHTYYSNIPFFSSYTIVLLSLAASIVSHFYIDGLENANFLIRSQHACQLSRHMMNPMNDPKLNYIFSRLIIIHSY